MAKNQRPQETLLLLWALRLFGVQSACFFRFLHRYFGVDLADHFVIFVHSLFPFCQCGQKRRKRLTHRDFSEDRLRYGAQKAETDCGLEFVESPALRGFVCGPRAEATAVLYLVLKSNG